MSMLKKVGWRFVTLSLVQLLNLSFPIVLYFLLLQRIEISKIGEIMSWQMVFAILASLSNYSFPIRLIPYVEKLHKKYVVEAYWNKLVQVRFVFFICIGMLTLLLAFVLPKIALFSFMVLVGKLISPSLFLPLLSKNKLLLFNNFLSRLIAVVVVFFMISTSNYFWTNFIIGTSELVVSILVLRYLGWDLNFKLSKFSLLIKFFKQDVNLFLIQFTNAVIVMITIPLTHLFFGAHIAGVISIIDKMIMVIRNATGNLFFSVLPETFETKQIRSVIGVTVSKFKILTIIIFASTIVCLFLFRELLSEKFINQNISYYLALASFSIIPIIMSTPYQIMSFRLKKYASIFSISKTQLVVLVVSLLCFGSFLDVYGIILSILLHESICFYLYRKMG
ncbi:hypothetical protein [Winogradskyella endarachnes]|uniref:Oligosaccharide flippase family protein n=1 Tax=Winogradskyella endarachnes TaxID=2681965 RepID=A0A6L6UAJ8_9FLAO|nr:hypothetical protein [Winogradskyella endarachnes]MUU79283.1 hypothetical protein [Winogradskyella endarachnes]